MRGYKELIHEKGVGVGGRGGVYSNRGWGDGFCVNLDVFECFRNE